MQLTIVETEMLIEALENLPNKNMSGMLLSSLLGAMVSKDSTPEEKAELERKEKRSMDEHAREVKEVKEKCDILKSKLVLHRADLIEAETKQIVSTLVTPYPPPPNRFG